jgi:hypothetical protein
LGNLTVQRIDYAGNLAQLFPDEYCIKHFRHCFYFAARFGGVVMFAGTNAGIQILLAFQEKKLNAKKLP